jgi:1-acylglycerone phosphate reductase
MSKTTVLITGCSDGSLGSALALQFHKKGYRVFATGRNLAKLSNAQAAGIEIIALDVQSEKSRKHCVDEIRKLTGGSLDILVNNAGAMFSSALSDTSVEEAKKMFDLNVWAPISMIQDFLPLLLKSSRGGVIVNHTSVASVISTPFTAVYGASKAALAQMTWNLRIELEPFNIKVVDLKTGSTHSNITSQADQTSTIPKTSLYYPAHEWLDEIFSGRLFMKDAYPAHVWAEKVVSELSKRNPPAEIWVGAFAKLVWWAQSFPAWLQKYLVRDSVKFGLVEKNIRDYGKENTIRDAYGAGATLQQ